MSFAWLSDKEPTTEIPRWRWPRRQRAVTVPVDEVFARAEDAIVIGEGLRPAADDPRVVTAIGQLHTLARDLLRWTR